MKTFARDLAMLHLFVKLAARRAWILAAGALEMVGLFARVARADAAVPESFRLVWIRGERTESCADGSAIARRVSARLGREVFTESATRSIEGVIQHEGQHWEAHIYARDEKGKLIGSRDILNDGQDCASLDAAVTLAIALTIDPEAALRPAPALAPAPASASASALAPVCPPPPLPAPPCPLSQPCPPQPTAASPRNDPITLTARALLAGGVLPGASPGMALAADVPAYRALHGTAGVLFLPETKDSTGNFAFGLTAAWLGPCVAPVRGVRGALSACSKVSLGAIHSVVYESGLDPTKLAGDRFWAGGSFSLEGRLRLVGPLVAEAGAELVFPITQQKFSVQGQAKPAYDESAVAGIGFLGLGVSIP
jgi:hypothetical protein